MVHSHCILYFTFLSHVKYNQVVLFLVSTFPYYTVSSMGAGTMFVSFFKVPKIVSGNG